MARPSPSSPALARAVPVFAALADPTRVHLISRLLAEGPLPITRLAEATTLSRQAVTKHLRALDAAGLATSHARGRERHWAIEARRLAEVRRLLAQISGEWEAALTRLARFVERDER